MGTRVDDKGTHCDDQGTHVDDKGLSPTAIDIDVDDTHSNNAVTSTRRSQVSNTSRTNTHMHRLISFIGILRMCECALSLIAFTTMCGAGSYLTVGLAYTLGANVIAFTYTSILVILYLLRRVQAKIYKLPIYELCTNIVVLIVLFVAGIVGPIDCSNYCSSEYTSGERSAIEASIVFTWLTGCVLVTSTLKLMLERSVIINFAIRDK